MQKGTDELGRQMSVTRRFRERWYKRPSVSRKRTREKLALLQENPAHPSLQVQVCAIGATHRLLFERKGKGINLLDIGTQKSGDPTHIHLLAPTSPRDGEHVAKSKPEIRSLSVPASLRRKQHFRRKW